MKQTLQQHITAALQQLLDNGDFEFELPSEVSVERTRDKSHGDYATNVALVLNKQAKCPPRDLADKIVSALPQSNVIEKCEIAGPGFINFTLNEASKQAIVDTILQVGNKFGHSDIGGGKKIQLEFVSANPTGPLHVGHGRGAAYGATVANLMKASGFDVQCEYYVNDAGRQMDILATSIWMRYLDLCGLEITFPSNGYKGDYVWDIAATLHRDNQDNFAHPLDAILLDIPADEPDGGDKDIHVDALIVRAKLLLGDHYRTISTAVSIPLLTIFAATSKALVSNLIAGTQSAHWLSPVPSNAPARRYRTQATSIKRMVPSGSALAILVMRKIAWSIVTTECTPTLPPTSPITWKSSSAVLNR